MRKIVFGVSAVVLALVVYLAATGWKPAWAKPSCGEARQEASVRLRDAVQAGEPPYVQNQIMWTVAEACNPDRAEALLLNCKVLDPHRDGEACREVPVEPERDALVPNLLSWIP